VKARVDFDGSAKYAGFPTEVPPPQRSELRFCSDSQYKRWASHRCWSPRLPGGHKSVSETRARF